MKQEEIDEMLKEASGPINFTVFLTMFGEKLKGETVFSQKRLLRKFYILTSVLSVRRCDEDLFTLQVLIQKKPSLTPLKCLIQRAKEF